MGAPIRTSGASPVLELTICETLRRHPTCSNCRASFNEKWAFGHQFRTLQMTTVWAAASIK